MQNSILYVIVIPWYEDIIFITWVRGGAKDESNNNDIIQAYGV